MAITTFTAAQVLTAAQMNAVQSNDFNQTVSTKTASYTLVAADKGTRIVMNSASATTITINTSLFSAGDTLLLQNIGAGVCTVTAGTATVSSAGALAIPQFGSGTLFFTSAGVSIFYPSAVTAASSGLTLISKQTIAATTQANLTNVFSATFDNYSVRWTNLVAPNDFRMRYGTSGTPDTASTYSSSGVQDNTAGTVSGIQNFNAAQHQVNAGNETEGAGCFIEISAPFLTVDTTYSATATAKQSLTLISDFHCGLKNTATSYTDLVFISVGNFSGTVYIYGYANS